MKRYDRTYTKLMTIESFVERFDYLSLLGVVGADTFGRTRYLNQEFYKSGEWLSIRDEVILRDNGCDLAIPGREISGLIIVHHLNPITEEDILERSECLLDMENLVCTSLTTHNALHYGDEDNLFPDPVERRPNDTCPWKGGR